MSNSKVFHFFKPLTENPKPSAVPESEAGRAQGFSLLQPEEVMAVSGRLLFPQVERIQTDKERVRRLFTKMNFRGLHPGVDGACATAEKECCLLRGDHPDFAVARFTPGAQLALGSMYDPHALRFDHDSGSPLNHLASSSSSLSIFSNFHFFGWNENSPRS
jgi:hypothetical protein